MVLTGEVIPSMETMHVARIVRESQVFMRTVAWLVSTGMDTESLGQYIKVRMSRAVRDWLAKSDCPFVTAAVNTALRSTVDWTTVARLVTVNQEAN